MNKYSLNFQLGKKERCLHHVAYDQLGIFFKFELDFSVPATGINEKYF